MRYYITTHWPPRAGDSRPLGGGVYLPDGRQQAGADLRAGDLVLVYQALSGRTLIRRNADGTELRVPCSRGRGGVVAIGQAEEPIHAREDAEPERYVDGTTVDWRWFASLKVETRSGFVGRVALNRLLGYEDSYVLRGFGDGKSGLKRIDAETFVRIREAFVAGRPTERPTLRAEPRRGGPPGGEGAPHRRLKEYVAGDPARALGEPGLALVRMEHAFPSGDRADVVLRDAFGRVLGVEVEVHVGEDDLEGFFQAIKYARMLEPLYDREPGDSRAVLVAYSAAPGLRRRFARYGVQCVEVAESAVERWHAARAEGA